MKHTEAKKLMKSERSFFRTRSRLWALPQTWPLTRGGGADWALLPIGLRLEAQYDFLKRWSSLKKWWHFGLLLLKQIYCVFT